MLANPCKVLAKVRYYFCKGYIYLIMQTVMVGDGQAVGDSKEFQRTLEKSP